MYEDPDSGALAAECVFVAVLLAVNLCSNRELISIQGQGTRT